MKIAPRQFPHPVLSPASDDVDAAFEVKAQARKEPDGRIKVIFAAQLSSPGLRRLIDSGQAVFAVHAECSRTRFRRLFQARPGHAEGAGGLNSPVEFAAEFPAGSVRLAVELTPLVIAACDIPEFRLPGEFHPDYEDRAFPVRKGDFLAWHDTFYLRPEDLEPARPASSVISVRQNFEQDAPPLSVAAEEQHVVILLRPDAYQLFTELRADPAMQGLVSALVTIPAVTAVLQLLREDDEGGESYGTRWRRALESRLRSLGYEGADWSAELGPLQLAEAAAKVLDVRPERILEQAKSALSTGGSEE